MVCLSSRGQAGACGAHNPDAGDVPEGYQSG